MTKFCQFCNKDCTLPEHGNSNEHWYWQPNTDKNSGRHTCKDRKRYYAREWDLVNPIKAKAKYKRNRDKRRSTPKGQLRHSFSSLMSYRLSGKSGKNTFNCVSYTLSNLMKHLESLFQPGMSWDNYGQWEVDHIKPDCSFNYASSEDTSFQECWALDNLQPLWARDNKIKNGKI